MTRLLTPFVSSAEQGHSQLTEALANQDRQLASEAAHKLAPKIRSIGLENLAADFSRIDKQSEVLIQNGEWESVMERSLLQLKAVIAAVKEDLEGIGESGNREIGK